MNGIEQNKYAKQAWVNRGMYSGKSDSLVLPKYLRFYRKPAKTVKKFVQKGIKTP